MRALDGRGLGADTLEFPPGEETEAHVIATPVVLIVFRRPDLTARVLRAISRARPQKLLVIADGPRADRPDDVEACAATRAVIDGVDWDCDVLKQYSDVNLGCGRRPGTGLSWAFDQVEDAIVLEDDCLPHPSFFRFCEELLERYRHDERVMHVAGSTFRTRPLPTEYSYAFSHFNLAWGWATWRRAWRHFDPAVKLWAALRDTSWLADVLEDDRAVRHWAREFEGAYRRDGDVSYWDHQWTFACWAHSGLSIVPRVNLVTNVGCGPQATHTLYERDPFGNMPAYEIGFPLAHPPNVLQTREWDRSFLRQTILPRWSQPRAAALRLIASRLAPGFIKRGYRQLAVSFRSTAVHRSS
jgi:hypothetical protein